MDLYFISAVVFIAVLVVIFYKDRKNVKRESILLLRKTQRGRAGLVWLGTRFPNLWKFLGVMGVAIGFYVSLITVLAFIDLTVTNLTAPEPTQGIGFVLPSPTQDTVLLPGVIGVPFWFWIISIALLVVVHEGFHGLMAAREKVRIKSLGWGLLAVIPLAFVEPDEKQLQRQKPMKQLRVFAAGSFANFVTAFAASFLLAQIVVSLFVPSGVGFMGYISPENHTYPAKQVNLTGSIVRINDFKINTTRDLDAALGEIGSGRSVTIFARQTSGEMEKFQLVTDYDRESGNVSKGFIGIGGVFQDIAVKPEYQAWSGAILFLAGRAPLYSFFVNPGLLEFIFLINLGVGMFNLLPVLPLDGGRMWKLVFDKYLPKQSGQIMKFLGFFVLALLFINFAVVIGASLG